MSETPALHHAATCARTRHELRHRIAVLRDALAVIGGDIDEFLAEHDRRALPREVAELLDTIAEHAARAARDTTG